MHHVLLARTGQLRDAVLQFIQIEWFLKELGYTERFVPRVQVTLTGTDDFRFNPATVTVKAGQPLQVTFQNGGELLHDFTVQQGLAKPVVITEDGGKSGTATVTYDKPGTYKFLCSQPGHDQLGMHGTITVQ